MKYKEAKTLAEWNGMELDGHTLTAGIAFRELNDLKDLPEAVRFLWGYQEPRPASHWSKMIPEWVEDSYDEPCHGMYNSLLNFVMHGFKWGETKSGELPWTDLYVTIRRGETELPRPLWTGLIKATRRYDPSTVYYKEPDADKGLTFIGKRVHYGTLRLDESGNVIYAELTEDYPSLSHLYGFEL